MIKSAEFLEMYKQNKISGSTLIKMAAFKDELNHQIEMDKTGGLGNMLRGLLNNIGRGNVKVPMPPASAITTAGPSTLAIGNQATQAFKGQIATDLGMTLPRALGQTAIMGGAMAIAAALYEGVKALEGKYQDFMLERSKQPAFNEVLMMHPELKDQPKAALYFDVLWHFAPAMADQPLTAGSYIKQAMAMDHLFGGPITASVGELAKIQKDFNQAGKDGDSGDGTMATIMMPMSKLNTNYGGGE